MRDIQLTTKDGPSNLHRLKGMHWIFSINENYFDCHGFSPPKKPYQVSLLKEMENVFIRKKNPVENSYCAAFCLCILYLIKIQKEVLSLLYCIYIIRNNYN